LYNPSLVRAKIKYLCDLQNITLKKMLSDLGYNVNLVTQATGERGLSGAVLQDIADYLNVSVDYILGRTNEPKIHGA